jgi:hypothetical protein
MVCFAIADIAISPFDPNFDSNRHTSRAWLATMSSGDEGGRIIERELPARNVRAQVDLTYENTFPGYA